MFSYSCPNIAVKIYKRVHLSILSLLSFSLSFFLFFFFWQNDVEAPAYLRTPGYAPGREATHLTRSRLCFVFNINDSRSSNDPFRLILHGQ